MSHHDWLKRYAAPVASVQAGLGARSCTSISAAACPDMAAKPDTGTQIISEDDFMAIATDSKHIISDLSDLIQLDYDAIAAYESAIERLEKAEYKAKLTEFLADHKKHVKQLSKAVSDEGGTPPTGGDAMQILTQGKVVIAGLVSDKAILKAMSANEAVTNTKYEEAMKTGYAEDIQTILRHGLGDERRHKDWIVKALNKL